MPGEEKATRWVSGGVWSFSSRLAASGEAWPKVKREYAMKIKVCPKCGQRQRDDKLLCCPKCNEFYIEQDTEEPLRLSDEHLDAIAKRVAKTFRQDEDLERIATKVVHSFGKDQWKPLAKQVIRSLNIVHDTELLAKTILSMW